MVKIYETSTELKPVSKKRPKALILRIPPTVRDILEFEQGTQLKLEVCLNDTGKKYICMYKMD